MPGVINLKVEPQVLVPQIEVRLRPEAAERFGLTPGHVRRASTTLLKGAKVGEVYEGQKKFDVVVWGVPAVRTDLAAIRGAADRHAVGHAGAAGRRGRRGHRADAERDQARERLAAARHHLQRAGPRPGLRGPRDRGARCKQIPFDREYHPEFLGEYAARQESTPQAVRAGRRWRWSASCCCCTSIFRPGGRRCSSR